MTSMSPRAMAAALILGATGLGLAPAPSLAAPGGSYSAALSTPLSQPRQEIVSGVLWKCAEDRCAAPAGGSRPLLVCERVAKAFGPVARFTSPTGELRADELARCNGAK